MLRKTYLLSAELVFLVVYAPVVAAQKNEVAVLVGGYVPIGNTLNISPALALEGDFAHRLGSVPLLALYLDVPVVAGFNVGASGTITGTFAAANYSALFITPGFKLEIAQKFFLSPFLVFGGGYARYHTNDPILGITRGGTASQGVYDFGGGMDVKLVSVVRARGEVRDFRSASPDILSLLGIGGHNIVATGGLVVRF